MDRLGRKVENNLYHQESMYPSVCVCVCVYVRLAIYFSSLSLCIQILLTFKNQVGAENWKRFADQFPQQLFERLHNMYGV